MFFGRGSNKYQNPYTLKDMYKEYIKDKEGPYEVSFKVFAEICREYLKGIAEAVIEGELIKMPFKLGTLSVISRPTNFSSIKKAPYNWIESAKQGKKVIETNDHTNYTSFLFRWSKPMMRYMKHIEKYQLIFTRTNKRNLAAKIKSGDFEYFNPI